MTRLILKALAVAAMAGGLSTALAEAELVMIPAANPNGHPLNAACKLLTNDEAVQVLGTGPFLAWEVGTSADGTGMSCRFFAQGKTSKYAWFTLKLRDHGSVDAAKAAWAEKQKSMQETVDLMKRELPNSKGEVTHVPGFGDDALTFGNTEEALAILKGQYVLEVDDVTYNYLTEAQVIQAANLVLPRL